MCGGARSSQLPRGSAPGRLRRARGTFRARGSARCRPACGAAPAPVRASGAGRALRGRGCAGCGAASAQPRGLNGTARGEQRAERCDQRPVHARRPDAAGRLGHRTRWFRRRPGAARPSHAAGARGGSRGVPHVAHPQRTPAGRPRPPRPAVILVQQGDGDGLLGGAAPARAPPCAGRVTTLWAQVVAWNQAFCESERPQSAPLLASLDSPFAFLLLSAIQTWALALELRGPRAPCGVLSARGARGAARRAVTRGARPRLCAQGASGASPPTSTRARRYARRARSARATRSPRRPRSPRCASGPHPPPRPHCMREGHEATVREAVGGWVGKGGGGLPAR